MSMFDISYIVMVVLAVAAAIYSLTAATNSSITTKKTSAGAVAYRSTSLLLSRVLAASRSSRRDW